MNRTSARPARASIAALTLLAALVAAPVSGAAETVLNASFEEPAAQLRAFTSQNDPLAVRGWDFWDPRRLVRPVADPLSGSATVLGIWHADTGAYPSGPPDGVNVAFLYDAAGRGRGEIGLRQKLRTRLQAGARYELRVAVGNPRSDADGIFAVDGFPGYRIELRAGGRLLASQQDRVRPAEGRFAEAVVAYRAGKRDRALGGRLEIRLVNRNVRRGGEVDFDAVRLAITQVSGSGGAAAGVIPVPYSALVTGGGAGHGSTPPTGAAPGASQSAGDEGGAAPGDGSAGGAIPGGGSGSTGGAYPGGAYPGGASGGAGASPGSGSGASGGATPGDAPVGLVPPFAPFEGGAAAE